MNKKEFLHELEFKLPPYLRGQPYLLFRKDPELFGFSRPLYYPWDFKEAIKIIERLAVGLSQPKTAEKVRVSAPQFNPTGMLISEILVEKITPWVKDLRQEIFESTDAPFEDNLDSSVRWIEEEAQKKYCKAVSQKLKDKMAALSAEFEKHDMILTTYRNSLPYAKKGEAWQHTKSVNGPKMALLERETRRIAKPTGFSQAALVMFVLTGIKPLASRVSAAFIESSFMLPGGQSLNGKQISLTFRGSDFTARELQRLYAGIRGKLKLKKTIPKKEKHLWVYHLVQELGPPPRGRGYWNYWKRALKEWKRRYKKKKPQTIQGLRSIYERNLRNYEP